MRARNTGVVYDAEGTILFAAVAACCLCALLLAGCSRHSGAPDLAPAQSDYAPGALTLDSPAPAGVDAALWQKLTAALREALAARDKQGSSAPQDCWVQADDIVIVPDTEGVAQVSWSFKLVGDYNFSGAVGMDDLVPIAIYFDVQSYNNEWTAAQWADGSGDGRIDLGDVTILAARFGQAISGYELQSGAAADAPTWTAVDQYPYSQSLRIASGKMQYNQAVPAAQAGQFYRAVPYYKPPVGNIEYGPAGIAVPYYGGTAVAGSWPMSGHDPRRSFRGDAPGPTAPRLAWLSAESCQNLVKLDNSPILGADNALYTSEELAMLAVQPDGARRWLREQFAQSCSEPAMDEDGMLYYTCVYNKRYLVRSLDPSGFIRWSTDVDSGANGLLVAGGNIYVHTFAGLTSLDQSGAVIFKLDAPQSQDLPCLPPTLTAGGLVAWAGSDSVWAVKVNGELEWSATLPDECAGMLCAFSDGGIAVPLSEGVCAYSSSGVQQWSLTGFYCKSNLALATDDSLRLIAQTGTYPYTYSLRALRRNGNQFFDTVMPHTSYSSQQVLLDSSDRAYTNVVRDGYHLACYNDAGALMWSQFLDSAGAPDNLGCALGADGGLYAASLLGAFCIRDDGYGAPEPPAVQASAADYYDYVRVSWVPAAHTDSFRLYRDGELLAETTELAFDDYGVPDGSWHAYTASGVNILGEGAQSAPAQGRIKLPPSRAAAPGDWAMQGHDAQHTFRSNITGPSAGVLKWSFAPGGEANVDLPFYNTPVFGHDGTAYVVYPAGMLAALDVDGTVLWRIKLGTDAGVPAIGADGTIYCAASKVHGTSLNQVFDYTRLYAINPNRTVKWFYQGESTSSQSLWDSAVTLDAAGDIHAVLKTGELVKLAPDGSVLSHTQLAGAQFLLLAPLCGPEGNRYVFSFSLNLSTQLAALDPDGAELWNFSTSAGMDWNDTYMGGSPTLKPDGTLYVPGYYSSRFTPAGERTELGLISHLSNFALAADGRFLAVNTGYGGIGWLDAADNFSSFFSITNYRYCCTLVDGAGKTYVAVNNDYGAPGRVMCFDPAGTLLWGSDFEAGGYFPALALRDDGVLFVTTHNALLAFGE